MTQKPPAPRQDHVGRQISVPHLAYYRAMHGFRQDLERAEQSYREEVAAIREKLGVPAIYSETVDVGRYSLAIQLFAAIAIEAAISFYAVLRFGGEHHDDHFRWDQAHLRLEKALTYGGISLSDGAEILVLVRNVMASRHRIAHPYAAEFSGPDHATVQAPYRREPDESAAAARDAIAAVERFFALLRDLDREHAHHFEMV